jgi:outer membrane protein
MMSKLLQSMALAASMMVATTVVQAQELKIGYVNSERVLRDSNLAKAAQSKLEAEFSKREKDLGALENKLRNAAAQLDKDSPTLSEAERNRRQRDVIEQDRDLQRKKREYQEDVNSRRNEEMQVMVEKANKVIKQIFDAEKYDLILQDAIHASAKIDITKKVIDALNAQK